MVKDMIEEVRAAESQAEDIIRQAEAQAQELIVQAKSDAAQWKKSQLARAEERAGLVREEETEKDKIFTEEYMKLAEKEISRMQSLFENRKEEAVSKILQYFMT